MRSFGRWLRKKLRRKTPSPEARPSKYFSEEEPSDWHPSLKARRAAVSVDDRHGSSSIESVSNLLSPDPNGPFFSNLPFEIREQIYLFAFGLRTLHVDYDHQYPRLPGPDHARLSKGRYGYNTSAPKTWRWWSCVCHRELKNSKMLHLDGCRYGAGWCTLMKNHDHQDCFVGVMGWLTSCRQACVFSLYHIFPLMITRALLDSVMDTQTSPT